MANPLRAIIRQTRRRNKLNILCGDTHERYQIALCETGQNFYAIKDPSVKMWNTSFGKIPSNYHHIDIQHFSDFTNQIDFDLVFSQTKFGQFQRLDHIAKQLHLPHVCLEHTVPPSGSLHHNVKNMAMMRSDVNVFLWEYSVKEWGVGNLPHEIVYHGFDPNFWQEKAPIRSRSTVPLTVVNDFPNRDAFCGYNLWNEATNFMPRAVWGDSPGLSVAAKDENDLVEIYNNHAIYINTSLRSSLPMTMLEAASCGCAIVTTGTCAIPEIFTHGENCLIGDNALELRSHIIHLQNEPAELERLGRAARQVIIDKLPMNKFVDNWNKIFQRAAQLPFLGTV